MSRIKNDYLKVTDGNGLVQPPDWNSNGSVKTSGNGARYTAEYVMALVKHNALDNQERVRLQKAYAALEKEPGLLMRTPQNTFGQQSVDDTVAAITADHYLKTGFAERWLRYGREQGAIHYGEDRKGKWQSFTIPLIKKEIVITYEWLSPKLYKLLKFLRGGTAKGVYNNEKPRVWRIAAWLWRQNQIVTHAKWVAGESTGFLANLYWCGNIFVAMRAKEGHHDADGYALSLHMIKVSEGKGGFLTKFLISYFRKKWIKWFKERRPGGLGQVLGENYGWSNHPSATWLKGEFGE